MTKIKILACHLGNLHCTILLAQSYFELAQSTVNGQTSHEGKWPMDLLARQENLLAPDYRTRFSSSPDYRALASIQVH